MFESRADTFEELLSTQGSGKFLPGNQQTLLGLELVRDVVVEEKLALGVARYEVKLPCWNEMNITRLRQKLPHAWVVFFGINTIEDYQKAKKLGANAVYTDNPKLLAGHQ